MNSRGYSRASVSPVSSDVCPVSDLFVSVPGVHIARTHVHAHLCVHTAAVSFRAFALSLVQSYSLLPEKQWSALCIPSRWSALCIPSRPEGASGDWCICIHYCPSLNSKGFVQKEALSVALLHLISWNRKNSSLAKILKISLGKAGYILCFWALWFGAISFGEWLMKTGKFSRHRGNCKYICFRKKPICWFSSCL